MCIKYSWNWVTQFDAVLMEKGILVVLKAFFFGGGEGSTAETKAHMGSRYCMLQVYIYETTLNTSF